MKSFLTGTPNEYHITGRLLSERISEEHVDADSGKLQEGVIMPEKIVAFCGLICSECSAFIAKRTNDNELREKTVEDWSSEEFPLEIEDINCDGCTDEGEPFKYCMRCEVRKCGLEKGVLNCAYCVEYPCDNLKELWNFLQAPEAREALDEIRKSLQ